MKVQQNTDVQMSNVQNQDYFSKNNAETPKGKRKEKDNTQSISGADLTGESLVVQRRKIARKQALKVVADAFKGELGIDAQLKSIRDKIHSLKDELAEVKENARDRIKSMMIGFGVDPESEEAKKAMDIADEVMAHHEEYMKYKFPQVVVVEEAEQEQEQEQEQSYDEIVINKVDAEVVSDLTEFQKAVVDSLGTVVKAIKNLNDEITQNVLTHKAIKIKRAESLNMLKAQKEAEKIMNTSTREVIEILANEAVNHLEEEKEREEEAKKAAEEKKEEKKEEARKLEKEAMQQEMIANIREHAELSEKTSADVKKAIARRERTEALLLDPDNVSQKIVIPDATSLEDAQSAVNSAITNILNSNFLVTDDIKGSAVDNQV